MIEVGEISSFHLLDEMYVEQKTLQIFVHFFFSELRITAFFDEVLPVTLAYAANRLPVKLTYGAHRYKSIP